MVKLHRDVYAELKGAPTKPWKNKHVNQKLRIHEYIKTTREHGQCYKRDGDSSVHIQLTLLPENTPLTRNYRISVR